jgi:hypothetical protein
MERRIRLHRALDAVMDAIPPINSREWHDNYYLNSAARSVKLTPAMKSAAAQAIFYNTRKRGDKVRYVPDGKIYTIAAAGGHPACDNFYTLIGENGTKKYTDSVAELRPV